MRTIILGVVIAVLGCLGLWFGGIPYTDRTELIDVGPIEASATQQQRVDIPPLLSGAIIAVGLGITIYGAGSRKA